MLLFCLELVLILWTLIPMNLLKEHPQKPTGVGWGSGDHLLRLL